MRVTWAGGVTRANGGEPGDAERQLYAVTVESTRGLLREAIPFALGDLGDGDNNHELCLDTIDQPLSVSFPAGILADPNDDLNPATAVEVSHSPELVSGDRETKKFRFPRSVGSCMNSPIALHTIPRKRSPSRRFDRNLFDRMDPGCSCLLNDICLNPPRTRSTARRRVLPASKPLRGRHDRPGACAKRPLAGTRGTCTERA